MTTHHLRPWFPGPTATWAAAWTVSGGALAIAAAAASLAAWSRGPHIVARARCGGPRSWGVDGVSRLHLRDSAPGVEAPALGGPGCDLRARAEAQLVADGLDVPLHGALGDEEALGDLPVGRARGDVIGDLRFPAAEGHHGCDHSLRH